jgi:putative transposase
MPILKRFIVIVEEECLGRMVFDSYEETYQAAIEYMRFYNERRIHSSILDLPSHEFYKKAKTEAFMMKEVRV